MRQILSLGLALALLAPPPGCAQPADRRDLMGLSITSGSWVDGRMAAFDAAADGVFNAVGDALAPILTDELADGLEPDSEQGVTGLYLKHLNAGQQRLIVGAPAGRASAFDAAHAQRELQGDQSVLLQDSARQAMAERYGLRGVGRAANRYMLNPAAWNLRTTLVAAPLSGAVMYFSGLRTTAGIGDLRLSGELAPVQRLLQDAGAVVDKALSLSLALGDSPVSISAFWDVEDRKRTRLDSVGALYNIPF